MPRELARTGRYAAAVATKKPRRAVRPEAPRAPVDAAAIFARLATAIPTPRCELDHTDAFTLLIATILSAQSTDKTVNSVTPELFRRWPTPAALAAAPPAEVEQVVHKTGFFRNKTKAILGASLAIANEHGGVVPRDLDALLALPGVARKTANVVLGTAYRIASGIVVDTHVLRVSQRLGLSAHDKPEKVEQDLCRLLPQEQWIDAGHRLLLHGRYLCVAKDPQCERCPLHELCPQRQGSPSGTWQQRAEGERRLVGAMPA